MKLNDKRKLDGIFGEWHEDDLKRRGMKEVYLNAIRRNIEIPKDVEHDDIFFKRPAFCLELKIWKLHIMIDIHQAVRPSFGVGWWDWW